MDPIPPLDASTPPGAHVHAVARAGADFGAALDRAAAVHRWGTAASASAPEGGVTLGQMLRAYAGPDAPTTALTVAPAAPAPAVAPTGDRSSLGIGPTSRPLAASVGSAYGPRRHPIHGDVRMHHGVDIAAPAGTPIHAFAAGTVTFAGPRGGYGNVVVVEHANGVESRYAHQAAIDVAVGQQVAAGEVVGRVGATGAATGPHLHFELRRGGESIDPGPHLP